jgi:ABC-type branched-subunit amino acid transport system permease subunit
VIVFLKNFVSVYTKRWLLILGGVYIGVILFAPQGLIGTLRRGEPQGKKASASPARAGGHGQ